MASNKKLKKAVRARMAETGETYTVARAAVLAMLTVCDGCGRTESRHPVGSRCPACPDGVLVPR